MRSAVAELATAEGADHVDLAWVTAEHLKANLGKGHDRLSLGNVAGQSSDLNGGPAPTPSPNPAPTSSAA